MLQYLPGVAGQGIDVIEVGKTDIGKTFAIQLFHRRVEGPVGPTPANHQQVAFLCKFRDQVREVILYPFDFLGPDFGHVLVVLRHIGYIPLCWHPFRGRLPGARGRVFPGWPRSAPGWPHIPFVGGPVLPGLFYVVWFLISGSSDTDWIFQGADPLAM